MSQDDLTDRLDAVERRLDAAYPDPTAAEGTAETTERIEAFAERLADLEAAVEAVEGYVGEIERVDDELEQRTDAALATTDEIEDRLEAIEQRVAAVESGHGRQAAAPQRGTGGPRTAPDGAPQPGVGDSAVEAAGEPPIDPERAGDPNRTERPEQTDCTCDRSTASAPSDGTGATLTDAPDATLADIGNDGRAPRESRGSGSTPRSIADVGADPPVRTGDDTAHPGDGTARPGRERAEQANGERRGKPDPQQRAVGTDGGQTHGRCGDSAAVSGWGDPTETATGQGRVDGRRDERRSGDDRAYDDRADDGWSDSSTQTLLDRLRSML